MDKLYENYKDIWRCFNESGRLKNIITVMEKHLKDTEYWIDENDNIIIGDFSKNRPCLVAHLDSVHGYPTMKVRKNEKNGIIYSDNGIGGDDKCGIIAILEILSRNDGINAILTSDEEVGAIGAHHIDTRILDNVMYYVEIDRAGSSDVIFTSGGNEICSVEMQGALSDTLKKYNFKEARGCFTDVNILTRRTGKSAINISAGYHNAHREDEYVVLSELQHTIDCVEEIVNTVKEVFIWEEKFVKHHVNNSKRGRNKESCGLYTHSTFDNSGLVCCDGCGKRKKTKSKLIEGGLFYLCKKCRKMVNRKELTLVHEQEDDVIWEEYEEIDNYVECSHCGDWVPSTELHPLNDAWGETKVCGKCQEYFIAEMMDY